MAWLQWVASFRRREGSRSALSILTLAAVLFWPLAACRNGDRVGKIPEPVPVSAIAIGDRTRCKDPELKLFDNTNTVVVTNGWTAPSFDTRMFDPTPPGGTPGTNIRARRYCLIRIETYHWNNGTGAPPGKIGLTAIAGGQQVPPGPWQAIGTPGQDNTPNANWIATGTTPEPGVVLIHGQFTVNDSSPNTWSGNTRAGTAFARVLSRSTRKARNRFEARKRIMEYIEGRCGFCGLL